MSEDTFSADDGLLVGPSDINGRKGIPAQMPDGKIWRVGGGEIIMNEKASTQHCEQLSKWNEETGGKKFSCDDQKKANTDRASGNMPKNEYHNERAAGGARPARFKRGDRVVHLSADKVGWRSLKESDIRRGTVLGSEILKSSGLQYIVLSDGSSDEKWANYWDPADTSSESLWPTSETPKPKTYLPVDFNNVKIGYRAGHSESFIEDIQTLDGVYLKEQLRSINNVSSEAVEKLEQKYSHIIDAHKYDDNDYYGTFTVKNGSVIQSDGSMAGGGNFPEYIETDFESAASGKPASFYDVMWQKPDGTMEIVQYEYPIGSGTYQAARQKPMAVSKWIANKERNRYKAGTIWAVRQDNHWAKLRLCGGGVASSGTMAEGGEKIEDSAILSRYPRLGKPQVQKIYAQVDEILKKGSITEADKYILEQYEGLGSQTQTGIIDKGLLHQFYTPYIVVKKMYDLAYHYGFNGGNICEPSMGTGRFFKYAPAGSKLFGFDPDKKNIDIAKVLYPEADIHMEAFETAFLEPPRFNRMAKKAWLPEIDLVIGNPPYGDYIGYYKSYMPSVFKRFEFLFIWLGLKLLKKDGLLVFIVSQNFMNNGAMYNNMKSKILELATFVDAIRMPNNIFSSTAVGTDIVIFRKK